MFVYNDSGPYEIVVDVMGTEDLDDERRVILLEGERMGIWEDHFDLLSEYIENDELPDYCEDPDNYLFFTEFLMVLKENDHIIGSIDFKYIPKDGMTEVGYGLNPAYEGCGYMTEALGAFLRFGKGLGIKTVRADTLPENVRSQAVLKRCGFSYLHEENGRLWWEVTC